MASGDGTKSRAPCSTSSINFGICCVISSDWSRRDGRPVFDNALNVGSVTKLVRDCRNGVGMETSEEVKRALVRPGMGVGIDWRRLSRELSDGTCPMRKE